MTAIRACRVLVLGAVLLCAPLAGAAFDPDNGEWGKTDASDLRVMTWNVRDGIRTEANKTEGLNAWTALARIVAAMKPDVLILQEMGDNACGGCVDTVAELTTVLDLFLHGGVDPFEGGVVTAYVQLYDPAYDLPYIFVNSISEGFNRNVILSRHPFTDLNGDGKTQISDIPFVAPHLYAPGGNGGLRGFMFAEIDLPDGTYNGDLVIGNAHLKSGGTAQDQEDRLRASQNVTYVIDHWYNGAGFGIPDPHAKIIDNPPATMILPPNTPVVIGGDWNEDEDTNGRRGPALWLTQAEFPSPATDGVDRDRGDSTFDAAVHFFTGSRNTLGSSKLDYIAWQDSIATHRLSFVFNSTGTPAADLPPELDTFAFPSGASNIASDHRPVIVDLILPLGGVPVGACCTAGTCTDGVSAAQCTGGGGVYQGDDSLCSGVSCPDCNFAADCNDGVACTTDACVAGACQNTPNHAACSNGLFCDGSETCSPTGCQAGTSPCLPGELCDEAADSCELCAGDADCDDGSTCTRDRCGGGLCTNADRIYGDVNADEAVTLADLTCTLDAFRGSPHAECTAADCDLAPCSTDGQIDLMDILGVLDAFEGLDACCQVAPAIALNEIYASHSGTDDREFIEIIGPPGGSLDGIVVMIVEGDDFTTGFLDNAWDLTGMSFGLDGYFVLGNAAVIGSDLNLGPQDTLENGTATFYVVHSANPAAILAAVGTDLDPQNDGVSTVPALGTILDLVAFVDGGITAGDVAYDGAVQFGPDGTFGPSGVFRAGDYPGDWCNLFLDFDADLNQFQPRTPGSPNGACPLSGACCDLGVCSTGFTQTHCLFEGGEYQGDGSDCGSVQCPQPTGACCIAGNCTDNVTVGTCTGSGGIYQGDGVDCGSLTCPAPTGACCTAGLCTEDETQSDCTSGGGTYKGDGSTCTGIVCPALSPFTLNEIYISHAGTDDQEFIEVTGTPGASLNNVMVLVVEGDAAPAATGTLDRAYDLSGHVMPANGYFVLGDAAVANLDLNIGNTDTLENSTETFYLILANNPAGVTALVGSDLDPQNDGTTNVTSLGTVLDLVGVVDTGLGSGDLVFDGAPGLGPDGTFLPPGIYRGGDFPGDWCAAFLDFDDVVNQNQPRTPGTANGPCP